MLSDEVMDVLCTLLTKKQKIFKKILPRICRHISYGIGDFLNCRKTFSATCRWSAVTMFGGACQQKINVIVDTRQPEEILVDVLGHNSTLRLHLAIVSLN